VSGDWGGEQLLDTIDSTILYSRIANPHVGIDKYGNALVSWNVNERIDETVSSTNVITLAQHDSNNSVWGTPFELDQSAVNDNDSGNTEKIYVDKYGDVILFWSEITSYSWRSYGFYLRYKTPYVAPNNAPSANAGSDETASAGENVELNGSLSSDSDGLISIYSWSQIDGPHVPIMNPGSVIANFDAPSFSADTNLTFELTVVDDKGAQNADSIIITVLADPDIIDITPPFTNGTFDRSSVKGAARFDITLTADEPALTYFQLAGQGQIVSGGAATEDWQTYTGPIQVSIDKKRSANFNYFSVDTAGNTEGTKTEVLQ
ncbi:PKD domain-containing protein, partial [Pseudomonadota bacterium]